MQCASGLDREADTEDECTVASADLGMQLEGGEKMKSLDRFLSFGFLFLVYYMLRLLFW